MSTNKKSLKLNNGGALKNKLLGILHIKSKPKTHLNSTDLNVNKNTVNILKKKISNINNKQKKIGNKITEHEKLIEEFRKEELSKKKGLFGFSRSNNSKEKIIKEKSLINQLKKECIETCDDFNEYYKINYENVDKFKTVNIEIIDLITNRNFIIFLDSLKKYSIKMKENVNNFENKSNCNSKCYRKKLLFIFIIDNYITDNLYNILIKILYRFYESYKGIISEVKDYSKNEIHKFSLFSIKDNIINIDFEAIGKFIRFELDHIRHIKSGIKNNNISDDAKNYFLISIIIFLFNYLYDHHTKNDKILKESFDNFMNNISYIRWLPKFKINFKRFKDAIKKGILEIKDFKDYKDIANIDYKSILKNLFIGFIPGL